RKKIHDGSRTAFVGRVGELKLEYVRQDHKTIIARSHCTSPWHVLPPIYLDDTGSAYTLLLNPSGGLVGGDHLSIHMTMGAEAHVLISTPSANRVYRSLSEASVQEVDISLGPGAILEWLPEHIIPFAGSRFRQSILVKLAAGASVLLWDAIASGRIASGERWGFTSLDNEIRITTASGASVLERFALDPATELGRIGLVEEWDYIASLYVVSDVVTTETWNRLEARLDTLLDERSGQILGGVSTPAVPGVAVKILARTAPDLTHLLEELWGAVRMELWSLPPVAWRKF
ncbi:MAG TPA: urease accessory protein UreD, partial [Nitrospiraceae bacterium]|nr:urease accessory protein UreD [Nitrospiraceae bacterium]